MTVFVAEVGKLGNRIYVSRVLKDGVLAWQGKRRYQRHLSALNAAQKKRDRMAKVQS